MPPSRGESHCAKKLLSQCIIQGCRHRGCLGEPGTPRFAKYPLRHRQVSYDFNISPIVPALPDLALASSYASFPVGGHRYQILWCRPGYYPLPYHMLQLSLLLLFSVPKKI